MPGIFALLIFLILIPVNVFPARAADSVAVAQVIETPHSYHLDIVTLEGSVREVRNLAPYFFAEVFMCYGAYSFLLEDKTGVIEVGVRGICGTPAMRFPNTLSREVSEGDRIVVEAEIHAPGEYAGNGFPLFGDVLKTAKAVVTKFLRVQNYE
jgi:hypothetical protein